MRTAAIIGAGLLLMAAAPEGVEQFGWMSGAWVSRDGDEWTEELWTEPKGGMLLGVNRTGTGDRATGFEFMRIAVGADGAISFWGSPGDKAPVEFRLTSSGPGEVVFENPAHDFPQRVRYARTASGIEAEISLSDGSKPIRWSYGRQDASKPGE